MINLDTRALPISQVVIEGFYNTHLFLAKKLEMAYTPILSCITNADNRLMLKFK